MEDLERAISNNPMAIPLVAVIIGILAGLDTEIHPSVGLFVCSAGGALYCYLLFKSRNPLASYRLRNLHYVWLAVCFLGAGIFTGALKRPEKIDNAENLKCFAQGRIESITATTAGDRLIIDLFRTTDEKGTTRDHDNLKISAITPYCPANVDDVIAFPAVLQRIEDSPNSFSAGYKNYMAKKGIYYRCEINSGDIRLIGHTHTLSGYSQALREKLEKLIEQTSLGKETQNFLITVLFGDRDFMSPELRDLFADAGVAHLLALSGMHIGIIGGIFLMLLFPLNFFGKFKTRLMLTTLLLWGYAFISGMAASTVRACVMCSFAAIGIALERKGGSLNSLFTAAFVILIFSPLALFDIGFSLSFICVASIIIFATPVNPINHHTDPRLYQLFGLIITTVAATFGSWIISAYYFNSFPTAFLPANLIAVPLFPIYISVALLHIFLDAAGIDFGATAWILDNGLDLFRRLLSALSSDLASLHVSVPGESVIMWLCGMVLVGLFIRVKRNKGMLYGGILSFMISLIFIPLLGKSVPDGSFIIRNDYRDICIAGMISREEHVIKFPTGKTSALQIGGKHIIAIDNELSRQKNTLPCDYLIVGGGFKGKLEDIIRIYGRPMLVIHPSVRRKREAVYLSEASRLGIAVHSIRRAKPLKILASDQ